MDMDNLWIVLALRTLSKQIIIIVRVIQLLIFLIFYHKEHNEFKVNVDRNCRSHHHVVKLRQGSGKDKQGMALKANGRKA